MAAGVGAGALARHGQVCWRIALGFAGPAAVGSLGGTIGSHEVGGRALILAFVPVMVVAAFATWQRASSAHGDADVPCPAVPLRRSGAAGLGVGALTGFFGVGGGFIIVPVLTLWFGVCFRRAVATSLVIIALTGLAGLASHLAAGTSVDVGVTAALAGSTAVGALLGTQVGGRLPQRALGRAFAVLVGVVAMLLLIDTLALGGPPGR